MTFKNDKPKRWRPRFSVRTLVILVTLLCVYLSSWQATQTFGKRNVAAIGGGDAALTCPVPFVVFANYPINTGRRIFDANNNGERVVVPGITGSDELHLYYFWFFGFVAELPYERHIRTFDVPTKLAL